MSAGKSPKFVGACEKSAGCGQKVVGTGGEFVAAALKASGGCQVPVGAEHEFSDMAEIPPDIGESPANSRLNSPAVRLILTNLREQPTYLCTSQMTALQSQRTAS
jgi:hypothetical protein